MSLILRTKTIAVAVLLLFLGFTACGVYTFNPRGKSSLTTIAVEPFENLTGQYGLEDLMTEAVIDAFIADGTIKVVSADVAQAVLLGTLTRYERLVQEFNELDQVAQYKVRVGVDITLSDPESRDEIWTVQLTLDGIYEADTETEEDGQKEIGIQLVEAVLNRTTKSW